MLGYLIIISCAIIFSIPFIINKIDPYNPFASDEDSSMFILIPVGAIGVLTLLIQPAIHIDSYVSSSSFCNEMKELQRTVNNTRDTDGFENATLTKKIMEHNRELASYKYYNDHILFDWYYNDKVEKTQPIQIE